MEIPSCHDVFPGTIESELVARLTDGPLPLDECRAFVPRLDPQTLKMDYLHVSGGRVLLENMQRTLKASRKHSPFDDRKLDWYHHVFTRLTLPWKNGDNSDTRMAFRSGHTYLTKRFFTFGKRTVRPSEVHVLQTSETPLLCYFPQLDGEEEEDRSFHHQRENFHRRFVLQPRCVYHFRPGTAYVLLTVVQTRFTLDRVSSDVANHLETLWGASTDPTAHLDFTEVPEKPKRLPKPPPVYLFFTPEPSAAADFVKDFSASLNEPPSSPVILEPECILEDLTETVDDFVAKYGSKVSTGWEEVVMGLYH